MSSRTLMCGLFALGSVAALKDEPKCALYTPGTDDVAGTWQVVQNATQDTCSAQGGQWILGWGQNPYPDHHPVPGSWWTKRMSDTGGADSDHHDRLHFSGRPSVRDMKQLYEAGWDAILSLEDAGADETLGIQPLPTTVEARQVAAEAGLLFHSLPTGIDFASKRGVDEITNFLEFALENTGSTVNGPLLVFDQAGFKAAAALQLFRARKGLVPKGISKTVTERATKEANFHGITLPEETILAIAREAGETVDPVFEDMRELPSAVEDSLTNYHWLKYLFHIGEVGVFDAGQVQMHHVGALKAANIKAIINMRQGSVDENGNVIGATQEPVNLLNLKFSGKTKGITDPSAFLADPAKKALVIDENRPPSWACPFANANVDNYTACVEQTEFNFETTNPLEWGDVGQNAIKEGEDFKNAGIAYYHLPVGAMQQPAPKPFNAATFAEYAPQFIEAVNVAQKLGGHVLFHCTIGYRTGAFPTALYTILSGKTMHNANTMMHSWGYDVKDEQTNHVFEVGSNALFNGLEQLTFVGDVKDTGRIAGDITLKAQTDATESTDATGTEDLYHKNNDEISDGGSGSDNGLLVAILIFVILTFAAASGACYMLYQNSSNKNKGQKSGYEGVREEEASLSMQNKSNGAV